MNKQADPSDGDSRKRIAVVIGVVGGLLLAAGIMFYFIVISLTGRDSNAADAIGGVAQYGYEAAEASNGMKLHALRTKAAFVRPEIVDNNVTLSDKVGVNGGFFYGRDLLSIGVVNGKPVNRAAGAYGSGGDNVKYARGTLVWDGAADALGVQVARSSSELKVKDPTRFWAQGGVSMSLGDDGGWRAQADAEHAPFPDEPRLRSGAVYDERGDLYLVVSETAGTLEQFRDAVKESFGDGRLVDGIFLDGDGSSQLLSREAALPGDNRPVLQMMRIVQ